VGTAQYSINGHAKNIWIKNDDIVYFNKVHAILDQIALIGQGWQLLTDITNTGKKVVIEPTHPPGSGNKCTSGGERIFYRLRAAFRGSDEISVRFELVRALRTAAGAGWTMEKICLALAGGMSPVTVSTWRNLRRPTKVLRLRDRQAVADQIQTLIQNVVDGMDPRALSPLLDAPRGQHALGDELLRFLRPWLRPGTGAGSKINFDPDIMLCCMGDMIKLQKRPPAIGLAHELCHAWRNAAGQRLFDDASSCGLDDDEVMTTGIPPYQYEKYSENLFRSLWDRKLPLRINYR
jgi:hypothetical protein